MENNKAAGAAEQPARLPPGARWGARAPSGPRERRETRFSVHTGV